LSIAAVLEEPHDPPQHLRVVGDREQTGHESAPDGRPLTARTVLVVEDEPALRESLSEIFRLQGFETVEAANGEIALQILGDRDVDVVILDLALPKLDGVSLLQRFDPPPPIVIIHSAFEYYSPDEVRRRTGAKVFRMVQKPIPPPQLLAAVSSAIRELENLES
jgi:DNA-binding response OmpR family regulator